MAYLVFVRHGQSEWNALGIWTGQTDVALSGKGREEARKAAEALRDLTLHKAYTSKLGRAQETLKEILQELKQVELETVAHQALNERDYGQYTGKNKWEVQKEIGDEAFMSLRRKWDHPVPGGETMKDVHGRAVPYFEEHILADLKAGRNVIVSAHGNSLRALMKHIENVPEDKIHEVEIGTAGVVVYEIDDDGTLKSKEIRSTGSKA